MSRKGWTLGLIVLASLALVTVALALAASPAGATITGTPLPSPNAGLYAVVGVTMDDVLNVRTGPGIANAISGAIPPYGTGIQTFGEGEQVGTSTWVVVQYKGNTGWVNSSHLTRQAGRIEDPVSARATEIVYALKKREWES